MPKATYRLVPRLYLTRYRQDREWSQRELGILVHTRGGFTRVLTKSEISKLELGRLRPTPSELDALGRVFDVDPDVLFTPVPTRSTVEVDPPLPAHFSSHVYVSEQARRATERAQREQQRAKKAQERLDEARARMLLEEVSQ